MSASPHTQSLRIVDTHQHLWDLSRLSYSWCKSIPALNRSFLPEDYLAAAEGLNIEKTVFVECDVDEPGQLDEARHVESLAGKHPLIAGIVASCRPEREGFRDQLEKLKALPRVKGVRRVLHVMPDETSQSPLFVQNVQQLADYSFSFDLCLLARQLPLAVVLVEKCPRVSFVLDHCGIPPVKDKTFDPWRAHIAELARHPNVVCKVSGLVAYADPENWTPEDLRPWVDHVVGCFGWDRVMWGSDWPVCTLAGTFRQWLEAAQSLLGKATDEQRDQFFRSNAERIYRLN